MFYTIMKIGGIYALGKTPYNAAIKEYNYRDTYLLYSLQKLLQRKGIITQIKMGNVGISP